MIDVAKSIQRKRLIYRGRSWYGFLTLIYPIFIAFVVLLFSYWGLEKELKNFEKGENWISISLFIGVIILVLLLIIAYLRGDHLKSIRGNTRSFNRKLVKEYLDNDTFNVLSITNECIEVDVKARFLSYHDVRRLVILFDKEYIYYNCTTFSYIQNKYIQLYDFKSPFAWFANRKVERKFNQYIREYL